MKRLTLVSLFVSQLAYSSFDMNNNIEKSYSYIINLEFDQAAIFLANEQSQNPNNGFIPLHKNYIDFLTIIIAEDLNYFKSHEHFKDLRLELLDNNDKNSPYYLYSKAEISLQWAFSRLKFEEYSIAVYEIVKAYRLLQENKQKFPNFTLNNKGLGLINTLLGSVPKRFHWILDLSGLNGGISLGMHQIDIVLNDSRFAMYESEVLFLLSFLQINLGNNNVICQKHLDRIGNRYQDNLLLNFAAARLSHNLGQNDYCLKILNNRPNSSKSIEFYYLDYLHGMSYLYKLDFENAKQKFEYFLANFRGLNYIKAANHKLAWISFLAKNSIGKQIYFEQVILQGNSLIDEDKVAFKDAKRNYISHPLLLKTRLLYDGGYYSLALSELNKIEGDSSFSAQVHQIEYWYRLARIESKLNNPVKQIIQHYKKVLDKGQFSSSYYAPMSALQIALLYEKQNNFQDAKFYFNRCLLMSDFDYERGIHQKARAGLERLSN